MEHKLATYICVLANLWEIINIRRKLYLCSNYTYLVLAIALKWRDFSPPHIVQVQIQSSIIIVGMVATPKDCSCPSSIPGSIERVNVATPPGCSCHSSIPGSPVTRLFLPPVSAVCKSGGRRSGVSYHVIHGTHDVTSSRHEDIFAFISPAAEKLEKQDKL